MRSEMTAERSLKTRSKRRKFFRNAFVASMLVEGRGVVCLLECQAEVL